jgi:hypothetical protein
MNPVVDRSMIEASAVVSVQAAPPSTITTTLYDLIAAMQASAAPGEDHLVAAAVVDLLRTGCITFRGSRIRPVCEHL